MERHNSTRFQSPIAILALVPCDSPIDTTARNFVPSQKLVVVSRNCFFLLWKVNPEGCCEVSCVQKLPAIKSLERFASRFPARCHRQFLFTFPRQDHNEPRGFFHI